MGGEDWRCMGRKGGAIPIEAPMRPFRGSCRLAAGGEPPPGEISGKFRATHLETDHASWAGCRFRRPSLPRYDHHLRYTPLWVICMDKWDVDLRHSETADRPLCKAAICGRYLNKVSLKRIFFNFRAGRPIRGTGKGKQNRRAIKIKAN